MQTMAGFDYLSQQVSIDEPYFYHKISTLYSKLGEEAFLTSCDDHNKENPFYIQIPYPPDLCEPVPDYPQPLPVL